LTTSTGERGISDKAQALVVRVKPFVPVFVKRPLRRALPVRYHHYVDPDWHRRMIRHNVKYWDYLGRLQLDYLVERGLEPAHHLLDVGCGPLRAGVHFIRYLEPGHYAGVDRRPELLEAGRTVELPRHGLEGKEPVLLASDRF
jgi:SAM-dependent methyltransferase